MKRMLLLSAVLALVATMTAHADTLVLITSRPKTTNYPAYWSQLGHVGTHLGARFTLYSGPIAINGQENCYAFSQGCWIVQEGNGYLGDFTKGDYLLTLSYIAPPLRLQFSTGLTQAGAQIEGRPGYSYPMTIVASDKNHNVLGTFEVILANNRKEDGSAAYWGIEDLTGPNIYYLDYSTKDDVWAINELSVTAPGCPPPSPAAVQGTLYNYGDVFASVGAFEPNGLVEEHTPNHTLVRTLMDGSGGVTEATGTAFDVAGNLYVTNFPTGFLHNGTVSKFDKTGKLSNAALMTPANDGLLNPESIRAVGTQANLSDLQLYVGGPNDGNPPSCAACILVYNSAGILQKTIKVAGAGLTKGTDWIDFLTPNILIYTGQGTEIKAYDIVANTQLPDLIDGLPAGNQAYQVRVGHPSSSPCGIPSCILPDPYILVADEQQALLVDPTPWLNANPLGSVPGLLKTTYSLPGVVQDFSLAIDPDGIHFWTGDGNTGAATVWQANTCTGKIGYMWNTTVVSVGGLTVWGGLGSVW
jgi:hypothetical protein